MITYTDRRYYRGYSLKQRATGLWEIWRGELISTARDLAEAEMIVDGWLDAR